MESTKTEHMANGSKGQPHKRLTKEQAEHLRESYEERRAILEYEGGYTRAQADRLAWLMTYGKR